VLLDVPLRFLILLSVDRYSLSVVIRSSRSWKKKYYV